ncbi:MAG TPA: hypothetical protein VMR88_11400 [Candidatus Polarisedimenticolaceae bacterium]|nr:hypothetical protein [Candidatus Polarisedimenticolaceae bacterium]
MIGEWTAALEGTQVAVALRNSFWSYPLVNAAHIFGVALLIGSVVPLDLRLLGLWSSVPLLPLCAVLTRTAGIGLVVAMIFGALLFITRATEYAASSLFIAKMILVFLGTANALLGKPSRPEVSQIASNKWKPSRRLQVAAVISLAAWLSALTLGRLVGYF